MINRKSSLQSVQLKDERTRNHVNLLTTLRASNLALRQRGGSVLARNAGRSSHTACVISTRVPASGTAMNVGLFQDYSYTVNCRFRL